MTLKNVRRFVREDARYLLISECWSEGVELNQNFITHEPILIQPSSIFINLDHIRIIQRLLFLNLFHKQQQSNHIREIVVLPFCGQLVSKVVHSGQTVALLCKDCNSVDWT